jgi:hypothetical protein
MGDELGSCENVIARMFDGRGSRFDELCWDGVRVLGSCEMLGCLKPSAGVRSSRI